MSDGLTIEAGGRQLVIDPACDDYWLVALHLDGVDGHLRMYQPAPFGLAMFFADLAAEWRGWVGQKSWSSLEGDFMLEAMHDGHGHVPLSVVMRSGLRTHSTGGPVHNWALSGVLDLEAGQLDNLARRAAQFDAAR